MKRKKHKSWKFVKYKGDIAIYAKCKCGFSYPCYNNDPIGSFNIVPDINQLYPFCPICGSKKKIYIEGVESLPYYRCEEYYKHSKDKEQD